MQRTRPSRSHFVFAVLQSGLTSFAASGIASAGQGSGQAMLLHWLKSWLLAWALMIPLVLVAAPYIRKLAQKLTREI